MTVDLVGTTFISKSGITSTTFKTVPDDPFSTFELVLPQGPYSALAANGNLCTEQSSLKLPVQYVGQNGATLSQDPQVSVTGCKPAIAVVKHSVKGNTATIEVSVPAAGKLVATGNAVGKASKTAKGATTLTLKLTLNKHSLAVLAKHKGRKLLAKVKLSFALKKGGKLGASTTVMIG